MIRSKRRDMAVIEEDSVVNDGELTVDDTTTLEFNISLPMNMDVESKEVDLSSASDFFCSGSTSVIEEESVMSVNDDMINETRELGIQAEDESKGEQSGKLLYIIIISIY